MSRQLSNYVVDTNPFRLAGPPQYFLRQLWEFDPSLAVVPSRQGFYYRLAQRRPLQLSTQIVNDVLREQADTQMLASYGLVPVTTIVATVNWSNPVIFEELKRRAPWRMGGAQQYEKRLLDQEHQEALDKRVKQDEDLTYLSKDAWRYYNKKAGLRSQLYSPVTKSKPKSVSTLRIPGAPRQYQPVITTAWGNPNT